jgi:sugar (pentulose or hexulose) kinase
MARNEAPSSAKLVLGLDVGTSAIKVGSFQLAGRAQAIVVRRHPIVVHDGIAEQNPPTPWLVPHQATFTRNEIARSSLLSAYRLRQAM